MNTFLTFDLTFPIFPYQELSTKIVIPKRAVKEKGNVLENSIYRQRDIGQHRFFHVILARVPIAITFAHSNRALRFVFHFVVNLVAETVGGYRGNVCFPFSLIRLNCCLYESASTNFLVLLFFPSVNTNVPPEILRILRRISSRPACYLVKWVFRILSRTISSSNAASSVENVIFPTGVSQNTGVSRNFIPVTLGARFTATIQFVTSTFRLLAGRTQPFSGPFLAVVLETSLQSNLSSHLLVSW